MRDFDDDETIFIGKVVGFTTIEKPHPVVLGRQTFAVKILPTEVVYPLDLDLAVKKVLPLEDICRTYTHSLSEVQKRFPLNSEVRVIAIEYRKFFGASGVKNFPGSRPFDRRNFQRKEHFAKSV